MASPISIPPDSETDEDVIRRVRAGDTAAYEAIVRRYNRRLYRIARTILRDSDEAEDVMQEAYVRAFVHLDQFTGSAKFSTWLTKIAIYEALGRVRRRNRHVSSTAPDEENNSMELLPSAAPGPEDQALAAQTRQMLETAIDALPDNYREVFVLRDVEGMTTAEAAECLELTEENVKVRLHRARHLLRDHLHERVGVATADAFQFMGARCDAITAAVMHRIQHEFRQKA